MNNQQNNSLEWRKKAEQLVLGIEKNIGIKKTGIFRKSPDKLLVNWSTSRKEKKTLCNAQLAIAYCMLGNSTMADKLLAGIEKKIGHGTHPKFPKMLLAKDSAWSDQLHAHSTASLAAAHLLVGEKDLSEKFINGIQDALGATDMKLSGLGIRHAIGNRQCFAYDTLCIAVLYGFLLDCKCAEEYQKVYLERFLSGAEQMTEEKEFNPNEKLIKASGSASFYTFDNALYATALQMIEKHDLAQKFISGIEGQIGFEDFGEDGTLAKHGVNTTTPGLFTEASATLAVAYAYQTWKSEIKDD